MFNAAIEALPAELVTKVSFPGMKKYVQHLASQVRVFKDLHQKAQKRGDSSTQELFNALQIARHRARAAHVGYCLLRGQTLDKIETQPKSLDAQKTWTAGGDLDAVRFEQQAMLAKVIPQVGLTYLTVVVDASLTAGQKAVQAAHAAARYQIEYPGCWKDSTLHLMEAETVILRTFCGRPGVSSFLEADLQHQLTAVAFSTSEPYKRSGVTRIEWADQFQPAESRRPRVLQVGA